MNIALLFKVPLSLLIEVFSRWVFAGDLARLDSALSSKRKTRSQFLEVLSSPYLTTNSADNHRVSDGLSYLNWLILREVSVRNLQLYSANLLNVRLQCPPIGSRLKLHNIEQLEVQGNEDLYTFVKDIINKARCLHTLKFSSLVWLTYPRLRGFLKICHGTLEVLQIDTVKYLYGSHVVKLVPYFRNLKELSLGRCELSKPFIEALTVYCRRLTQFQFSSSPVHTDSLLLFMQSFSTTAPIGTKGVSAQQMKSRNSSMCTTSVPSSNQLTSIALTYNTGVRLNRIGTCIADHCSALRQLTLVGDYDISDALSTETLIYIARSCKMLRYVDVSKNNYVENSAILSITEYCPDLTHLIIHSCRRISDDSIAAVSLNCAHLQVLDVSWCDNITNASLQLLSGGNTGLRNSLRELKINSCFRITSRNAYLELPIADY